MTQAEWQKAERELMKNGYVNFMIDGYKVTVVQAQITATRSVLIPFIDGEYSLKWLINDKEIVRRFFPAVKKGKKSANKQEEAVKKPGKKGFEIIKTIYPKPVNGTEANEGYYTSFKTMKATFTANNSSIRLI